MVTSRPTERPTLRKSTLAIAAIAVVGFSTSLATDADARGGGGHGFRGGGHSRSFSHTYNHSYGSRYGRSYGHRYGYGHVYGSSYGRHVFNRSAHVGGYHKAVLGKGPYMQRYYWWNYTHHRPSHKPQASHPGWHLPHGWGDRARASRYGGTIMPAGGGGSSGGDATPAAASAPVAAAAPPAAATPSSSCDYLLPDEPGCYMAMRPFSTPAGTELRCTKICDAPGGVPAAK